MKAGAPLQIFEPSARGSACRLIGMQYAIHTTNSGLRAIGDYTIKADAIATLARRPALDAD
ncbi:MAG: hypothetical protein ACK5KM_01925 [Hyphomicrobiaceae bacterium]